MNGRAIFGDQCWPMWRVLRRTNGIVCGFRAERGDDKHDGGIRDCSRRGLAGLLPAHDPRAEPSRRRRSPVDGSGADGDGGEGWSISHWFGGNHFGFDSSGNPTDSGGGDSGGGDSGGGGDGGGGGGGGG